MAKRRIPQALARLARAEADFFAQDFLAPVDEGSRVHVGIAGVICSFSIEPRSFRGWGVFRPTSQKRARLQRAATLAERSRYLQRFPVSRVILCGRANRIWLGMLPSSTDSRAAVQRIVPVRLVEEAGLFDCIVVRRIGPQYWFDEVEPRTDPALASYLRQALEAATPPTEVRRPGLGLEQRQAYALEHARREQATQEREALHRDPQEQRLRAALELAGARFLGYHEHGDLFTVTYELDGTQHVAAVNRSDLTVESAGICLSGRDADFDLQSLVGVLRELHAI